MKKDVLSIAVLASLMLMSCGSSKVSTDPFAPEEAALNLIKITDESSNVVVGQAISYLPSKTSFALSRIGGNVKNKIAWGTNTLLDISPDGKKIAYCTRQNKQDNVMVRSANAQGVSTQRTFRNISDFSWGSDNRLYFSDYNGTYSSSANYICSINAESGSTMSQHTNGSVNDLNPVMSSDNKTLFFCRLDNGGPMIWSLDKEDGTLTSCARGYNPCLDPNNQNAFYCVRNNTNGRSEIWYVDFVKGVENLIVSDENRSFTNPKLSPDGKWLVMVGNAVSTSSKKKNLDIFAVRTDGANLTQLTYHPASDVNPVWGKDGKSIYFISSRANKDQSYNVWRMQFNLE